MAETHQGGLRRFKEVSNLRYSRELVFSRGVSKVIRQVSLMETPFFLMRISRDRVEEDGDEELCSLAKDNDWRGGSPGDSLSDLRVEIRAADLGTTVVSFPGSLMSSSNKRRHTPSPSRASSPSRTPKAPRVTASARSPLLCTLPPTCHLPNRPTPLSNSRALETHYATHHAHVCSSPGCGCVFPDARLLELVRPCFCL